MIRYSVASPNTGVPNHRNCSPWAHLSHQFHHEYPGPSPLTDNTNYSTQSVSNVPLSGQSRQPYRRSFQEEHAAPLFRRQGKRSVTEASIRGCDTRLIQNLSAARPNSDFAMPVEQAPSSYSDRKTGRDSEDRLGHCDPPAEQVSDMSRRARHTHQPRPYQPSRSTYTVSQSADLVGSYFHSEQRSISELQPAQDDHNVLIPAYRNYSLPSAGISAGDSGAGLSEGAHGSSTDCERNEPIRWDLPRAGDEYEPRDNGLPVPRRYRHRRSNAISDPPRGDNGDLIQRLPAVQHANEDEISITEALSLGTQVSRRPDEAETQEELRVGCCAQNLRSIWSMQPRSRHRLTKMHHGPRVMHYRANEKYEIYAVRDPRGHYIVQAPIRTSRWSLKRLGGQTWWVDMGWRIRRSAADRPWNYITKASQV
jgi:hypothetical protein